MLALSGVVDNRLISLAECVRRLFPFRYKVTLWQLSRAAYRCASFSRERKERKT